MGVKHPTEIAPTRAEPSRRPPEHHRFNWPVFLVVMTIAVVAGVALAVATLPESESSPTWDEYPDAIIRASAAGTYLAPAATTVGPATDAGYEWDEYPDAIVRAAQANPTHEWDEYPDPLVRAAIAQIPEWDEYPDPLVRAALADAAHEWDEYPDPLVRAALADAAHEWDEYPDLVIRLGG